MGAYHTVSGLVRFRNEKLILFSRFRIWSDTRGPVAGGGV